MHASDYVCVRSLTELVLQWRLDVPKLNYTPLPSLLAISFKSPRPARSNQVFTLVLSREAEWIRIVREKHMMKPPRLHAFRVSLAMEMLNPVSQSKKTNTKVHTVRTFSKPTPLNEVVAVLMNPNSTS